MSVMKPLIRSILPEGEDPYWDNVVSLLHFKGGSVTDEKGVIWTFNNEQNFSFTDGMYSKALSNSSISNSRLYMSETDFFNMPSWTIDIIAAYDATLQSEYPGMLFIGNVNSNNDRLMVYAKSNGTIEVFSSSRGTDTAFSSVPIDDNYHLYSFVRHEGKLSLFIDGVLTHSETFPLPSVKPPVLSLFTARVSNSLNNSMIGAIESVRITKGVARYTENFTPPNRPFPNK